MRLAEIRVEDVLAGKNWVANASNGEDLAEAAISEAVQFTSEDHGFFSAVVKFGDDSVHAGLVVKSFPHGGDDVDLFVYTKFGWLNIHTNGFMRAVGKYSHEVFPFEYYVSSPWKGGAKPLPDHESPHKQIFAELAPKIVAPQVTKGTGRRDRPV